MTSRNSLGGRASVGVAGAKFQRSSIVDAFDAYEQLGFERPVIELDSELFGQDMQLHEASILLDIDENGELQG